MKFSMERPVKIVMLGAGGTGGHIAPHLYRLLYSLERPVRYKLDTSDPQHPKCVGVQGIDNDFSFCAHANGKSMADIVNMKIIRKETAEALFSMKPEMIKTVLGKYDLSPTETFAVLKRIGELKQAVENGTLKVVTDEQIRTMNYQTELISGGDNYFERLMRVPQAARRQAFESDGAAMDKAYRGLNANTPALGRCYDGLVAANQGKFIGSKEYKAILNGLQDLIAHRSELLNDRDPERVALYERRLSELRTAVSRYLIKKAKEARHSKPSKLAERCVAAVRAFSAKLGLEEAHIQDYREAEAARERYLNGMTQHEEYPITLPDVGWERTKTTPTTKSNLCGRDERSSVFSASRNTWGIQSISAPIRILTRIRKQNERRKKIWLSLKTRRNPSLTKRHGTLHSSFAAQFGVRRRWARRIR